MKGEEGVLTKRYIIMHKIGTKRWAFTHCAGCGEMKYSDSKYVAKNCYEQNITGKILCRKILCTKCGQRDQAVDGGEEALCAQNDGVGSPRLRRTIRCQYKYNIANTNTNTKKLYWRMQIKRWIKRPNLRRALCTQNYSFGFTCLRLNLISCSACSSSQIQKLRKIQIQRRTRQHLTCIWIQTQFADTGFIALRLCFCVVPTTYTKNTKILT